MKIESKQELDLLVSALIQNQNIEDKEQIFNLLREKVLEILISKGDIIPPFYLNLYFIFKDLKVNTHPKYSEHIKFFKNYYPNASLEEKFIINNFLFGLEILNGNFSAVKEYIKRSFLFNTHKLTVDKEGNSIRDFLKNEIDEKIAIETFKEMIEPDYFFALQSDERRSIFTNSLAILWNNPTMYNNKIWLDTFDSLVDLLNKTIEKNLIEEQMYIHFFTYHIYGNNIQTLDDWRIFNETVEQPASLFYKKFYENNNLKKAKTTISKNKKRIGFLIDRIILTSPFMVLYSLFKALMKNDGFKNEYEIYLYSMNYLDKQSDNKKLINRFLELDVKFFSPQNIFAAYGFYYSHLEKAIILREKIIEDKIDYLIGGGGYDISIFLFATRTAPKQFFWSHGNCVSEFEGVDERISHFDQECKEWNWKIFGVPIAEEFLVGTNDEKEEGLKIKNRYLELFGKDTIILGTIGRLVKIDSEEYLKTIAQIMNQNQNIIYLACGSGNIENIKNKIKKYGIDKDRFIFTGMVNPHIYGWVIDIWPDTFPLGQGISKEEFLAKGKPIVYHRKREDFKNVPIQPFLAETDDEYIQIINKLIEDQKFKEEIISIEKYLWFEKDKKIKDDFVSILN
ncbi:hypothetical protein RZR97_00295 [Hydrogenimonas thermophila]|uniref:hypothetical protein n=1 Tax=Hydrogenimonas thermophila TaxID=223786 RepID=UPI002936E6EA|nr:hypothetical protein [Hydrogenimonas thermophila]WOE70040.1 hypothetical protein RZR91_00295 [Hydrogenimonas thermophila]WOE72557.1 hypothetical protein RZR97_00295 [Hydrogenimonas thermophila]